MIRAFFITSELAKQQLGKVEIHCEVGFLESPEMPQRKRHMRIPLMMWAHCFGGWFPGLVVDQAGAILKRQLNDAKAYMVRSDVLRGKTVVYRDGETQIEILRCCRPAADTVGGRCISTSTVSAYGSVSG